MSVFGALQAVFRVGTALVAQIADGLASGGNPRGANAVDWQTTRTAANQVAAGPSAVIGGGQNNLANSGTSTVAGGGSNLANNVGATVGGGNGNTASGNNAVVAGGTNCTASGQTSTVAGGNNNNVNGIASWCPGGTSSNSRGVRGRGCWAAVFIAGQGDAQCGEHHLARQTTDATATRLTADAAAASTSNTINLPNFAAYAGLLIVTAKATGSADAATWRINVSAARGNGAGTVVVYEGAGTAIVPTASNGTGSGWRLDIAADTTNGGIAVTATGAGVTTINWSARFANVETVTAS